MQNALCNRYAIALILGESVGRFVTTTTEGRSGNTAKNLRFVTKTVRIMRLTAILLTVCSLSVTAKTVSQSVTYSAKNVKLQQVFEVIKKQTGFFVFFDEKKLEKAKAVTVDAESMRLTDFLDWILKDQPFLYSIQNTTITIKSKPELKSAEFDPRLISPFLSTPPIAVRGKIINEKGEPVVASVIIKGTNRGTTSNANGEFELTDVDTDAVLVISATNIETVVVNVNGQTDLSITTKTVLSALGEVVYKGYYTETKRLSTGSVAKVSAEEIAKQPVLNPLQAIQGRMAGVQVVQTTGMPGGGFTIQIRGQNSLREDANDPLYIIDGVPFTSNSLTSSVGVSVIRSGNPLSSINPSDILNIEVLKDADATAIYGSRGSNGVVLITTKKSKTGKTGFDLNINKGYSRVASKMDLLNTEQYLEMRREAYQNDNRNITAGNGYDLVSWDQNKYTDWQDALIGGTAHTTNISGALSGGNAKTSFLLGGAYYKETTVFPGDFGLRRLSGNFNLNHTSENGKLHANFSLNYSNIQNNLNDRDITARAIMLPPNAPDLYDSTGNLNGDWKNNFLQNPLFDFNRKYNGITDNFITNAIFSYDILDNLKLSANVGYTNMQVREVSTSPISALPPQFQPGNTGAASFGNSYIKTWIAEPQLGYTRKIGMGKLSLLAGSTFQRSVREGQTLSATGYTSDALIENILAAPDKEITGYNYVQYKYAAIFGRANFNWQDKYLINLTGRRDGSSRFGSGKQFANFGAVGIAWVFSSESFIKDNLAFIDFGKIRGSYGTTGSDAIPDYQYLNTFTSTQYSYAGTSGLIVTRLTNPDFSWEVNKKLEAALEMSLFKQRMNFSAAWYRNRSSNQLVGLPLPVITGQSSIQFNLPATVQNTGWEFQLNTINIRSRDFQWSINANLTLPKNELVAFPDLDKFTSYVDVYKIGEPLSIKKTLVYDKVDPTTGVYTFKDIDNSGSFSTTLDKAFTRSIAQKYYAGLGNVFQYKSVRLDIFFQFVNQTGMDYLNSFTAPGTLTNQSVEVLKRWRKDGDISNVQRFTTTGAASTAYNRFKTTDYAIVDASFIRLKNVSLSWNLPAKWLQQVKIKEGSIFVQGQNLLTFTEYAGLDPETRTTSFLPPLKTVNIGISVRF